jgi:hypothetical protein
MDKNPRIAFCLFGASYGNNNDNDNILTVRKARITYDIGYKYFKKYIFDNNNNIDIFIHTWNNNKKDDILNLYKPVDHLFEPQIDFTNKPNPTNVSPERLHSQYSRWYSTKKVIELKNKYENTNNFKYDYVFLSRFDIYIQKNIIFSEYEKNILYGGLLYNIYDKNKNILESSYYFDIIKNTSEKDILHVPCAPPPWGESTDLFFHDLFFLSNSDIINVFGLIFDNIPYLLNETIKIGRAGEGTVSNCRWIYHQLKQHNLLDKVKLPFKNIIDYGLVRRKYFNCTK